MLQVFPGLSAGRHARRVGELITATHTSGWVAVCSKKNETVESLIFYLG